MNKDIFLEEMLNEIKNIKDLAKEELPIIAKEYILAGKVQALFGIGVGTFLLIISITAGLYGISHKFGEYSSGEMGCGMLSLISGTVGTLLLLFNASTLLDFLLQPRRMAIKAITSLRND